MKRLILEILTIAIAIGGIFAVAGSAQSRTNRIYRPCSATTTQARVEVQADGDIDLVPCSGRSVLINGVATSNTLTVSGSSRTNYFPFFSTETNLAKSPFLWNGTNYLFNNTAENAEFTLSLTPSSGSGRFRVGDFTTTPTASIDVNESTNSVSLSTGSSRLVSLTSSAFSAAIGGLGSQSFSLTSLGASIEIGANASFVAGEQNALGNSTIFTIRDLDGRFDFASTAATPAFDLSDIRDFLMRRTVTPGGTTGNQTIGNPVGTVNFAAGTGTAGLTVTNSLVTASSIILATARTNDATCAVKNVVAGSGSFVITMTANCTAETSVGFWVMN